MSTHTEIQSLDPSEIQIDAPSKGRTSLMVFHQSMEPEFFRELIQPIMKEVKGRWMSKASAYYVPVANENHLRNLLNGLNAGIINKMMNQIERWTGRRMKKWKRKKKK